MKNLILSLDYDNIQQSQELLNKISSDIAIIKIGHCLLSNVDKPEINKLCGTTATMLDFKFFDIPNTILKAISGYAKSLPTLKYFTFNGNMATDCIEKIVNNNSGVSAIAVLILSSDSVNLDEFIKLAHKNYQAGVRNFICPPAYIAIMRKEFGDSIKLFSPGIRSNNDISNDHSAAMTVADALTAGGDFFIVGRPLLNSSNPQATIKEYK